MGRVVVVLHLKLPPPPKAYQLLLLGVPMAREKDPITLPLSKEEPLFLEREISRLGLLIKTLLIKTVFATWCWQHLTGFLKLPKQAEAAKDLG